MTLAYCRWCGEKRCLRGCGYCPECKIPLISLGRHYELKGAELSKNTKFYREIDLFKCKKCRKRFHISHEIIRYEDLYKDLTEV